MAGWEDIILGLATEIIGAIIVAVLIYLLFTRQENKREKKLEKTVLERITISLNSVISNSIYNLQADAFEPLDYVASLSNTPVSKCVTEMAELSLELSDAFNEKGGMLKLIAIRKKQLSIITSEEFLANLKLVVGQWDRKQWLKYFNVFQGFSRQVRDLMDIYQSRLHADIVCKIMDLEKKASDSLIMLEVVPEYFGKIEQLKIELNNKQIINRHMQQIVACEQLQSMLKEVENFQNTYLGIIDRKPITFNMRLRKAVLNFTLTRRRISIDLKF